LPQKLEPEAEAVREQSLDSHFGLSDVRDVLRADRLLAIHGRSGETDNVGNHRSPSSRRCRIRWRCGDRWPSKARLGRSEAATETDIDPPRQHAS